MSDATNATNVEKSMALAIGLKKKNHCEVEDADYATTQFERSFGAPAAFPRCHCCHIPYALPHTHIVTPCQTIFCWIVSPGSGGFG
jgi:hypothetical protein